MRTDAMFSIPFLHSLTSLLGVSALDDSVDRLSCLLSAFIFLFSSILISARTYVGSPIECWLPQTYSGQWAQFSESYCFLKDTYWFPDNEPIGYITEDYKKKHRLQYYQWSSMYLAIAALVFMVPKFIWKLSQSTTDMPILYFCETTQEINEDTPSKRKDKIAEMAELFHSKITARHTPYSIALLRPSMVYASVKLLYLLISFTQFFVLAIFLGQEQDVLWGWTLAMNLLSGITWEKTGLFPRITFCDFTVRELAGNNSEETIQCLIGVNEFNEKMFLFLWFWLVFVFGITLIAYICSLLSSRNHSFIKNLLHVNHDDKEHKKEDIVDFSANYLTKEGKLVLSFIKSQCDVVANELTQKMFEDFIGRRENKSFEQSSVSGDQIDLERASSESTPL